MALYRRIRSLPGVKHAFIGSGFRHDLFGDGRSDACLEELCRHHVGGLMKVAPEHISPPVLDAMGKPRCETYEAFVDQFNRVGTKLPSRRYLVNYFISAHPGSTLKDALELALYLIQRGMHPEQVQDFIPLPMTLSGAMYYTGKDPQSGQPVYVAKTFKERKMQRALIQYRNPANRALIREALTLLAAERLMPRFFKSAAGNKPPHRKGTPGRKADTGKSPPKHRRVPAGKRAFKEEAAARRRRRR